jgi:hypothetical protein
MSDKKNKYQKKMSFTAYDAAHLYELALERFSTSRGERACPCCARLKRRLENFIGPDETQHIQKLAPERGCPRP